VCPVGPPFTISEPGEPTAPQVARSGSDGFVVVWVDNWTLQGRRLDAQGTPVGMQFELSGDYPTYYNFGLGGDPTGRFVVTWESEGSDGDEHGVVAQRFDAANTPLGSTFVVNTYTTGLQFNPSVAVDPDGTFVIAWESQVGQDGYGSGVFAQRYDASGAPAGGEFQVNVTTALDQSYPAVATQPSGDFLVVWRDEHANCGPGCVIGRRDDAGGAPQTGEFVVSDGSAGPPSYYNSIDVDTSATGEPPTPAMPRSGSGSRGRRRPRARSGMRSPPICTPSVSTTDRTRSWPSRSSCRGRRAAPGRAGRICTGSGSGTPTRAASTASCASSC
jgi:hypothetical protein